MVWLLVLLVGALIGGLVGVRRARRESEALKVKTRPRTPMTHYPVCDRCGFRHPHFPELRCM